MGRGGRGEEEKDRYGARVRAFLNTVSFFFFFAYFCAIMYCAPLKKILCDISINSCPHLGDRLWRPESQGKQRIVAGDSQAAERVNS